MKITRIQIRLVQRSFGLVATQKKQIAHLFFDRLFEQDPALRSLFAYLDAEEQGERVLRMLALIVSTLDDMQSFDQVITAMGQRHIGYGVRKADYQTFNQALLWAMSQCLGDAFTPAMCEAWRAALDLIATTATEGQDDALT